MDLAHEMRGADAAFSHRLIGRVEIAASFGGAGGQPGARMIFHPGARTDWHSHPAGQTVLVTDGEGLLQRAGGPIEPLQTGDVVWFEPGQRRWFGAAPDASLVLIALGGADVVRMERVDRAA